MQDPKDKLELKENVDSGVYVKDLTTFVVKSAMEIDHVMQVSGRRSCIPARAVSSRGVSCWHRKTTRKGSKHWISLLFRCPQGLTPRRCCRDVVEGTPWLRM